MEDHVIVPQEKKKKAVLIELKHPDPQINDGMKEKILRMKDQVIKLHGFPEDNITLMIDDEPINKAKIEDNMDPLKIGDKKESKMEDVLDLSMPNDEFERGMDVRIWRKRAAEMAALMPYEKKKKKKKAVLVGLKHPDPQINDGMKEKILRMKEQLIKLHGFKEDDIILMIQDDQEEEEPINKDNIPTNFNIQGKLMSVVGSAGRGDIVFIHLIAYGCSDSRIIAANKEHIEDAFFRGLVNIACRKKGCNLTFVSDCLIEPAECKCPEIPTAYKPWKHMTEEEKEKTEARYRGFLTNKPKFSIMGIMSNGPTTLSSVDILNPNINEAHEDEDEDDDSNSRVILLMPFRRDQSATIPISRYSSELLFPPPPKGASSTTTSPQPTSYSYGGFTNALLDVIEETHGQVTNLELAQKAMDKLGGDIPSLRCNHDNHAYASFVC